MKLRFINFGVLDTSKTIPGKHSPYDGLHGWMDKEDPLLVGGLLNTPTLVGASSTGSVDDLANTSKMSSVRNIVKKIEGSNFAVGAGMLTNTVLFRFCYPKYSLFKRIDENQFVRTCFISAMADTIELLNPNIKITPDTRWSVAINGFKIGGYIINATSHSCYINLTFDNMLAQQVLKDTEINRCQRTYQQGINDVLPNVTADIILAILPPKVADYLGIPFEVSEVSKNERPKYDQIKLKGLDVRKVALSEDLSIYSSSEISSAENEEDSR